MEESEGAARFYDLVYEAERPELFFKANAWRVVGPGDTVRIRRDSRWNVPEPELTLVVNSRLELVAFTIGNDMSSRDIEGENPLYLPQAKVYDQSCALGPCLTLAAAMPKPAEIGIRLAITRAGKQEFAGNTTAGSLIRSYQHLIDWLGRDHTFPDGACLLTGTGVVPEGCFTLEPGDEVRIEIDGIGELVNVVERK
jgi:2-dehydro-3-deoxy-D-arabinonate dehydratase